MKRALEPGLVQVFRLFVGVRLALLALTMCAQIVWPEQRALRYPLPGIIETVFLLGYLSWPWLRKALGEIYLPFALLVATVGPIFETALAFGLRLAASGPSELAFTTNAWQLILILFVPLVLLGWQYDFVAVVVFCVGTALLDLILGVPLARMGDFAYRQVVGVIFVRTLLYAVVGYLVVRLVREQRARREALAEANARLAHYAITLEQLTVSRERNRLARDLHDTLAHTLSALAVQLEAISALWETNPSESRAMLDRSLAATRDGLAEARRAIQALRSAPLEDLGLALALRSLAESMAERAGWALDLRLPLRLREVRPEVEQCLYRVADEALTNIARYANAGHVAVALERSEGRLVLTVSDDGCGFDPTGPPPDGRYGLMGMRERAEVIGAILEVESQPGRGATIRLIVEETD
jgi:signal transduction histidine kinase